MSSPGSTVHQATVVGVELGSCCRIGCRKAAIKLLSGDAAMSSLGSPFDPAGVVEVVRGCYDGVVNRESAINLTSRVTAMSSPIHTIINRKA